MEALLEAAVRLAIPLLLAALGELIVERAGLINIGTEGVMLSGAFVGFAVAVSAGSPVAGVAGAAAAGVAVGALFALFAVIRRIDQIVVGTAINLLALGATGVAARALYGVALPEAPRLEPVVIPGLASLPFIGRAFFAQPPHAYAAFVVVALLAWGLARIRPGLRLRAVGESARAADAEGVAVERVRIAAALAGGALAGVAGSALTLTHSSTFTEGMTAGRGFIALSIVIFGRWRADGVLLAALFFGGASALQHRLQARGTELPYQVALMFPYVVTLLVLVFASRRARAPADLGRPYRRP